jgi:hypothetical protein
MNNINLNDSYIGPDELIYNNDGEIHSGGFSVNSIMLKHGLSPIITLNNTNVNTDTTQIGGNQVSDLFNNLVIPNWSLAYNYKNSWGVGGGVNSLHSDSNKKLQNDGEDDDEVIEESLHDKLLNLVKVDKTELKATIPNKKSSKKNLKNKKNLTKKNYKKL